MKRRISVLLIVALFMSFSGCGSAPDADHPQLGALPTVYITLGEGKGHNWWGVLYEDALLWARADEGEEKDGEVVFLWPIWEWLCRLLGIQSG